MSSESGSTGGSSGGFTGGISGSSGSTSEVTAPTTDEEEEEEDVIECGYWICPQGDYACAPQWNDQEWQEIFMEVIANHGVGDVATMEATDAIEVPMALLGVKFARNSAGVLRGRIYLPTYDYCQRWERAFDVITGWDGQWAWTPRGNYHW